VRSANGNDDDDDVVCVCVCDDDGLEQIVRVLIGSSPLPGAILKSSNHVRVIMEIVGQSFGLPIKVRRATPPTTAQLYCRRCASVGGLTVV
jgi:hypothetical protein